MTNSSSRPRLRVDETRDVHLRGDAGKRTRGCDGRRRGRRRRRTSGGAATFENGELVYQAFKFGDEVGGDKDGAMFGVSILVGADDGLHEFAADDRIQSGLIGSSRIATPGRDKSR